MKAAKPDDRHRGYYPAQLGLLDLPQTLQRLQQTTFRASSKLLQAMLDRDGARKSKP
jgi:hypothetical protein